MQRRTLVALVGTGMYAALAGGSTDGNEAATKGNETADDGSDASNGRDDSGTDIEYRNADELSSLKSIRNDTDRHGAVTHSFSGSGDTVTETAELDAGVMIAIFDHEGDGDLRVERIDSDGRISGGIITSGIQPDRGAVAVPTGGGEYGLEVTTDGEWSVELVQPEPSVVDHSPAEASGEGFDVLGPVGIEGETTIQVAGEVRPDGDNFRNIQVLDQDATAIADTEPVTQGHGDFDHEVTINQTGDPVDGTVWISVEVDGEWSIEIE
ncbi:hypothetical protein [Natronolimnohabitans innermongolicus]|nr:hypothetical protein [Natronolimnohabitans innermongolicus]